MVLHVIHYDSGYLAKLNIENSIQGYIAPVLEKLKNISLNNSELSS